MQTFATGSHLAAAPHAASFVQAGDGPQAPTTAKVPSSAAVPASATQLIIDLNAASPWPTPVGVAWSSGDPPAFRFSGPGLPSRHPASVRSAREAHEAIAVPPGSR